MSRIAKRSIIVPNNIKVILKNQDIVIQGEKGTLKRTFNKLVNISYINNILTFKARYKSDSLGWMQAGTARSLTNSMIIGVTCGFSKKLHLIGVGYKFSIENINTNELILSLGYSHNIKYIFPLGINIELISSTEILIKGIDKQLVGQVSANLRKYRKPDSYKGKGVRYFNEFVKTKEAKKK
ncbi:50S ribosomal protein L6 [Buchnera aphidicola]|uniref:50S ribosomal protein L6 n=1 Tax=Buchnera aphidicola TaxID=9 RepID=UPI002237AE3E|nr:50S ribosomal protein L6 [Buchnera aphidicola]MCW5197495.1 50S ribosomal protein L6 [Buchnera aphidicola (Chaitophorus viminalis)]